MSVSKEFLDAKRIIQTLERLCLRIEDRFPQAGLLQVAHHLPDVARETDRITRWIDRPHWPLRLFSYGVIVLILAALGYSLSQFRLELNSFGLKSLVELSEAVINELILLGAAIVFIVTFENRRKRNRVIASISRLRSIAHVIDVHQLTKDPGTVAKVGLRTKHSPDRTMTPYELDRYLDYCSEMLSLTGKVAFLYVQRFNDSLAVTAVNDLENLTVGLSRKIWQKIMMLRDDEQKDKNTLQSSD